MDLYERKISVDEEKKHYIFVTKDAAQYFPSNTAITIRLGNMVFKTKFEATPCDCMGPKHPHEHCRIPLSSNFPLKQGKRIILQKTAHDEFRAKII